MMTSIGNQLLACGIGNLPPYIRVGGYLFRRARVYKHDFFAATVLYERTVQKNNENTYPERIILKIARRIDFLGIPLEWLGVMLCAHEICILRRLRQIPQVPRLLGRFGKSGLVYKHINGCSLDEQPKLPDDFFDDLEKLLHDIHSRRIIYLDLNKRGNILLGDDNLPYLIDFQISQYISERFCGSHRLARFILLTAQREDFYHLFKHKRRLRPDLMDPQTLHNSRRISRWINLHRLFSRPFIRLRRGLLYYLYKKNRFCINGTENRHRETHPQRWRK